MRLSRLQRSLSLLGQISVQGESQALLSKLPSADHIVLALRDHHLYTHGTRRSFAQFASLAQPQLDKEQDDLPDVRIPAADNAGDAQEAGSMPSGASHAQGIQQSSESQQPGAETELEQPRRQDQFARAGITSSEGAGTSGQDTHLPRPTAPHKWQRTTRDDGHIMFGNRVQHKPKVPKHARPPLKLPPPPQNLMELGKLLKHHHRRGREGATVIMHTFEAFLGKLAHEEKTQGLEQTAGRYPNVQDCYIYLSAVAILDVFDKIRKMETTLRLLEDMGLAPGKASANLYSLLLRALSRQGTRRSTEKALGVIKELEKAGAVNWFHYAHGILTCIGGQNEFLAADRLVQKLDMLPPDPDVVEDILLKSRVYQAVIIMYAQQRRMDKCLSFVRKTVREGMGASPQTLQVCASYGIEMDCSEFMLTVLNLFALLQDQAPSGRKALTMDEGTMLGIMHHAGRTGSVPMAELAWRVMQASLAAPLPEPRRPITDAGEAARYEAMQKDLQRPLPAAWHALIDCYCKADDFRSAFRTMRQLEWDYPESPQVVAHAPAMTMVVDACARSVEKLDHAYFVLEDMHAQGEAVTTAMLNCVIAACGQVGDMSRAFETFESFGALGLKPNTNSYNAIIAGCAVHNLLDSIPKVLEEMEAEGHHKNELTHTLMVKTHLARRNTEDAVEALAVMRDAGFSPGMKLYDLVLLRCQRAGDFQSQARLLRGPTSIIPPYLTTGRVRKFPVDIMGSGAGAASAYRPPEARAPTPTLSGPRFNRGQVGKDAVGHGHLTWDQVEREKAHGQQSEGPQKVVVQPEDEAVWEDEPKAAPAL
ncbi:hypothetical protein WJX73_004822 [Symbiochloris irregularis]|uniref:Pentatricopeptide repeat-containing protein-mitochondrial domain-containing protein n=1 Tax=Symbiochloris irregularis TaxID=706552 RepID=A0AAW1NZE8_9CHLO